MVAGAVRFFYNWVVAVTITQFRQNLFQFADQALNGETIEFIHKGVTFKVVPKTKTSKLARLTALENVFPPGVDPGSIVNTSDLLKEMDEVVLVGWTKKRQSLDRAAGC